LQNAAVVDPFAIAKSYPDLIAALVRRRRELGLSTSELDDVSGMQLGYVAKLENGSKNLGPMSFDTMLSALGLQVALVAVEPPAVVRALQPDAKTRARRELGWQRDDDVQAAGRNRRRGPKPSRER
jgi:transcriptional regulator with XRE-family HTH domain